MLRESQRFIGLDVHKASVVVAAVDRRQTILLSPRRITINEFPDWLDSHLQPTDAVVMEASGMSWTFYDMLEPLVGQVTIAHAAHVKLIASSLIKTDKRDALVLARLLAANLIPPVWVPVLAEKLIRSIKRRESTTVDRNLSQSKRSSDEGCMNELSEKG